MHGSEPSSPSPTAEVSSQVQPAHEKFLTVSVPVSVTVISFSEAAEPNVPLIASGEEMLGRCKDGEGEEVRYAPR